jgi:uncharacterized phage protein (TIGR01671 family)
MEREIKFRGLRVDGQEWVYGSLSMVDTRSQRIGKKYGQMFICNVQTTWQTTDDKKMIGNWIEVLPESVGQYTGLKDKNDVEIYEGDLIEIYKNKNGLLTVNFQNSYVGGWVLTYKEEPPLSLGARNLYNLEVKGNIYENKELINA